MALMKSVENGVQAKSAIEYFISEGYEKDHIHVFANSNKRAEDIATFFDVDAKQTANPSSEDEGLFQSIKNFFQTTPEDFDHQLIAMGLNTSELSLAKDGLDAGKLIIIAHHPNLEG